MKLAVALGLLAFVAAGVEAAPYRLVPAGPMVMPRIGHAATRLPDGRVLISGGRGSEASMPTAATEIFDPATRSFSPGPRLRVPRQDHAAVVLPDGRVLVAGGSTLSYVLPTASAEILDPRGGSVRIGDMAVARGGNPFLVVAPDGDAWIFGGQYEGRFGSIADLVERLPMGAPRWIPSGRLALPCQGVWLRVDADRVLRLHGGIDRHFGALAVPCRRWSEEHDLRVPFGEPRLFATGDGTQARAVLAAETLDGAGIALTTQAGMWLVDPHRPGSEPSPIDASLPRNTLPVLAAWTRDELVSVESEVRVIHPLSGKPPDVLGWSRRASMTLTVVSRDMVLICGGDDPTGEPGRRTLRGALLLVRDAAPQPSSPDASASAPKP